MCKSGGSSDCVGNRRGTGCSPGVISPQLTPSPMPSPLHLPLPVLRSEAFLSSSLLLLCGVLSFLPPGTTRGRQLTVLARLCRCSASWRWWAERAPRLHPGLPGAPVLGQACTHRAVMWEAPRSAGGQELLLPCPALLKHRDTVLTGLLWTDGDLQAQRMARTYWRSLK